MEKWKKFTFPSYPMYITALFHRKTLKHREGQLGQTRFSTFFSIFLRLWVKKVVLAYRASRKNFFFLKKKFLSFKKSWRMVKIFLSFKKKLRMNIHAPCTAVSRRRRSNCHKSVYETTRICFQCARRPRRVSFQELKTDDLGQRVSKENEVPKLLRLSIVSFLS